ncbi:hypothetical protein LguiA_000035 [Lonicera macranthoides]
MMRMVLSHPSAHSMFPYTCWSRDVPCTKVGRVLILLSATLLLAPNGLSIDHLTITLPYCTWHVGLKALGWPNMCRSNNDVMPPQAPVRQAYGVVPHKEVLEQQHDFVSDEDKVVEMGNNKVFEQIRSFDAIFQELHEQQGGVGLSSVTQLHDFGINDDDITKVETEDDKSVARTGIVPFKSLVPSSMFEIGLSPRATNNLRVSYALLNKEQLHVALKRDGDLLNRKFHMLSLRDKVMAEDSASVVPVVVTHKKRGRKKEAQKKKVDGSKLTEFHLQLGFDFVLSKHGMLKYRLIFLAVYAKCSRSERTALWEEMVDMSNLVDPLLISGDYNVVRSVEERVRGNSIDFSGASDFNDTISKCGLLEFHTMGSTFTWQRAQRPMWQKLDRYLCNYRWRTVFSDCIIDHLSRENSDHASLLGKFNVDQGTCRGCFKFQTMLQSVLVSWNWDRFGNVLKRVEEAEQLLSEAEKKG